MENRDIKFRAWLPDDDKMLYSENAPDDDYMDVWQIQPNGIEVMVLTTVDENPGGKGRVQRDEYQTPKHCIMQFTGLKDKNGVEIYEGDILKVCNGSINGIGWLDKPYSVKYVLNSGFIMPMFCWDKQGNSIMDSTHHCEIIGNIYQNSELCSA